MHQHPGPSAFILGPSGSGKSHLCLTAAEEMGAGAFVLAPGVDEVESYAQLFPQAEFLVTEQDRARALEEVEGGKHRLRDMESPYLIAAFDDEEFFPSESEWKATGHKSAVNFVRLLRAKAQEKEEPPYPLLTTDTLSGVGELANNAMLSWLKQETPPKAKGEGGAEYYVGLKNKVEEFCRACRSLRGYGMTWLATSHVSKREVEQETYTAQDVGQSREQLVPLFTGSFRERLPGHFDLVLFTGVDKDGEHYALYRPDMFRASKSRYAVDTSYTSSDGKLPNDWPTIRAAIQRA